MIIMSQDNWEPCPRCGSNRVQQQGVATFIAFGFAIGLVGVILLFVFLPLGLILLPCSLLFFILSPLGKNVLVCQDCKKSWRINKKEAA